MSGVTNQELDNGEIEDEFIDPDEGETEDDGGDEGDEGSTGQSGAQDQDDGQTDEGQEGQVRGKPGRRENTIRALRREAQEAKEEAARTAREFREFRDNQGRGQPQQQEDPRAELERLAAMSPEERNAYNLDKATRQHQFELGRMRYEMADTNDKAEFKGRAVTDPRVKKYEPQVEQLLAQVRTNLGWNPKREVLYYYLIGQKVANSKGKVGERRQQGRDNVRRVATKPTTGRSDVPARGREGKSFEDKYGDEPI